MAEIARGAASVNGLPALPEPSPPLGGGALPPAPPPAPQVQSVVAEQLSALTVIVKEGFTSHKAEFELFRQQMTVMGSNFD
eukprot:420804-Pyramimonas_sp.AAC.1